jgi:putative ABC transport system ATP-binding protein
MLQTHPLLRLRLKNSAREKVPPRTIPRANAFQKFILLFRRNARLLWRDKTVFSMLALPPVIALMEILFASAVGSESDRAPFIFGLLAFLVLLTSALLVQNEISRERPVYQYENRTRTLLFPYVLSKVWLAGLLAVYQSLVWTVLHAAGTGMAGGSAVLLSYGITIFMISLIGGIVGLLVSALAKTSMSAANWLLLFTVPPLIFSGSILPTGNLTVPFLILSGIDPLRYALNALLTISGYGEGLANTLFRDWSILGIMVLCLIALLMGIQARTGNTST